MSNNTTATATVEVTATLASMIRRSFAKMSREQALQTFNDILDNSDNTASHETVRAEVLKVFEAAPVGARLSRESIQEKLSGLVGSETIESKKVLQDTLVDVLQGPEFKGLRGRNGGFELATPRKLTRAELEAQAAAIQAQLDAASEG